LGGAYVRLAEEIEAGWQGESGEATPRVMQQQSQSSSAEFPSLDTRELELFSFETVFVNRKGEIIKRETCTARYFRETLGLEQQKQEIGLEQQKQEKSFLQRIIPRFFRGGGEIERGGGEIEAIKEAITLDMVAIPGGTFLMGSPAGEGRDAEHPQHEVTFPSFFMSKTPITQAQWHIIASRTDLKVNRDLDPDPARFKDDPAPKTLPNYVFSETVPTRWDRPVERVSWYEAVEFCDRLSQLTGREYRLPSEAEWEYACRAILPDSSSIRESSQNTTYPAFHFGETLTDQLANYNANNTYAYEPKGQYRGQTTPVGSFPPNAFGLYDMHGNVWEWCLDDWHDNYEGAPTDGSAWLDDNDNYSRSRKILRGGSWCDVPHFCRVAFRINVIPGYLVNYDGFRVVCVSGRTL